MQGYFGGLIDLLFQRFIEIWSSMPELYLLIILASFIAAQLLVAAAASCCCSAGWALVGLVRAEFLRERNFDYVRAARALGVLERAHHVAAHPAQRHDAEPHLPAVHPGRLDHRR